MWRQYYGPSSSNVSGGYIPLELGKEFRFAFYLPISKRFSLGVGVEYLSGSKESSLNITEGSELSTFSWNPKIQAYPIFAAIRYNLIDGKAINIFLEISAQYIFARYSDTQHLSSLGDIVDEYKTTGKGFGYSGGIGVEYFLIKNISFTIESHYRYAQIPKMSGELASRWGSLIENSSGTLWSLDIKGTENDVFNIILLSKEKPSGSDFQNVHETRLNLGGFRLSAGLAIHF